MLPEYELVILPSEYEIVIQDDNITLDMHNEAPVEILFIGLQGPPGPRGTDGIPVLPDVLDMGNFA